VNSLTVLYDARCSVCCRAREWLGTQPSYVSLEFIGAGSGEALARFPELRAATTQDELTVVANDGAIYRGVKAWLICLWAMRRYRSLALTLSTPALLPSARGIINLAALARRPFVNRNK